MKVAYLTVIVTFDLAFLPLVAVKCNDSVSDHSNTVSVVW